jgi:hypothetical protein
MASIYDRVRSTGLKFAQAVRAADVDYDRAWRGRLTPAEMSRLEVVIQAAEVAMKAKTATRLEPAAVKEVNAVGAASLKTES